MLKIVHFVNWEGTLVMYAFYTRPVECSVYVCSLCVSSHYSTWCAQFRWANIKCKILYKDISCLLQCMSYLLYRANSIDACWPFFKCIISQSCQLQKCCNLCDTQMDEYRTLVEWLHRKKVCTRTNTDPSTTSSTINPTCSGLGSNLCLHDESDQQYKPWHSFILSLFVNLSISPAHIALWTLYSAVTAIISFYLLCYIDFSVNYFTFKGIFLSI
jgi:hypothetical protein